jgi:squalene-hopene/tetraprenyl-beta-curcumene cyclase
LQIAIGAGIGVATIAGQSVGHAARGQEPAIGAGVKDVTSIDPSEYQQVVDRAVEYLRTRAIEDGAISRQGGTGVNSLCIAAILAHRPEAVQDPAVQQALDFLQSNIRPDGGIYAVGSSHKNYETCLAIHALVKANRNGKYDGVLAAAEAFVKGIQWDQGEGLESSDPAYGGAGYGSHKRPDLSNTAYMIDALKELGRDGSDEAIQKALLFVSRTQNLESGYNDTPHASKVNDGGFYYTPAAGGESQAGKNADGGLRSYGSMTYAGLKSMLYAGVTADDPRVKASMDFIRNHYSVTENPGMGAAGLFYYYHTFAKALDAAKVGQLEDAQGQRHDWRSDLFSHLAAAQSADGSWVNEANNRWMEGDRSLVTGYALLALAYCKPGN